MKLWILDADAIIDFFRMDVFDKLVMLHELHVASAVADEVRFFKIAGQKIEIDFRSQYVINGKVNELSASASEIGNILSLIPPGKHDSLDGGELESLAILVREKELTFCTCDAAAIRVLPFLEVSERGVSVEKLLKKSGLQYSNLKDNHTERYFKNNLSTGSEEKVLSFNLDHPKK